MRGLRRYYQIFFLILFFVLLTLASQGRIKGYPVTLFLDSSPLNGLGALLSSGNVAHTMWIGFVVLALTFLLGRFFCGWICPLGTIFNAASWLLRRKKQAERIVRNRYHAAQGYKYTLLIVLLAGAAIGVLQVGHFDPISLLTRTSVVFLMPSIADFTDIAIHHVPSRAFGSAPILAAFFILLLVLNGYRERFWCRYACPLGALLGLAARFSPGAITRDTDKCTDCGRCVGVCPAACEPDASTKITECFVCWNCTEICPENALEWSWYPGREQVDHAPDLSRRQFAVAATCGLAGCMALRLSGTTLFRGYPHRIRPPGSLSEIDFLARCLKCGECVKICPTNVLQPSLLESGLEGLWTPVLNMNRGYCELNCTLCSKVCPSGAIRRITIQEKLGTAGRGPIRIGTAFLDRTRCIPWSSGKKCVVCEEVCPVSPKAIYTIEAEISVDGRPSIVQQPQVIASRCTGCGICQYECPVQDLAAIRVTAAGESRDPERDFILK